MDTIASPMPVPYVSPDNGAALIPRNGQLEGGGKSYPVINDIPQFLRFEPDRQSADAQALVRLVAAAKQNGWREALKSVYGDIEMVRYVTDDARSGFLNQIPFPPEAISLEIGPGLGQFTPLIAARSKWVCAMEVDPMQSEFTALRAAQEGASNVSVACGGDDCRLPYPDNSFDVIVLNLVFEWCGSHDQGEPAAICQRRLLDEMHRVLKSGGVVWLTTKNRYALRALLGKRDEHCYGMRFGNALPRPVMNMALRLKGHKRPRGRLYSFHRLQKMLAQSRLEPIHSFWAAPEMRYPSHYIPTDGASIRAARKDPSLVQGETRIARALMPWVPAGLVKHFTPGLAFLARKR